MCGACWVEAGSPKELPRNFKEFQKLHDKVGVGGGLHVQLDDYNLSDEDILKPHNLSDLTSDEMDCLAELSYMTEAERIASMAHLDGCF